MKHLHLLLVLSALSATLGKAQGISAGSTYLKIPVDARAASLGDAVVGDAARYSSAGVNPASLASEGSVGLLLSHTQWIQDIRTEFVRTRLPFSFGTIGAAISNTNIGGIELRETPGPAIGTFAARAARFQIGFARNFSEDVTVGAGVSYLYEKLYLDEATGFGFDVGGLYRTPVSGLSVALAITNIGSLSELRVESSDLPAQLRAGGTYGFARSEFAFSICAALLHETKRNATHLQVGVETTYDGLLSFRVGYQSGYESRGFSSGIGLRYSLVDINYAYVPFSLGLGDAHLFTVGFEI
ncbi:MAG TPA: hypothetical protein DCP63_15165 [Bacteroidetes bacterium]|nr:hypothetical protein [Bacteroidota bacterium]